MRFYGNLAIKFSLLKSKLSFEPSKKFSTNSYTTAVIVAHKIVSRNMEKKKLKT